MSGGSFDYLYMKVEEMADEIIPPARTKDELEFAYLLNEISALMHDLEWVYSGDYSIGEFQEKYRKFRKKWLKEV